MKLLKIQYNIIYVYKIINFFFQTNFRKIQYLHLI